MVFPPLSQRLLKEQERAGREDEEQVERRTRPAEREGKSCTELLRNAEEDMQASYKFQEEFLGGARQLGLESDWREVRERLQQADSGQDRTREGLTETDTVGDVAGRKVRTTCRAGKNTDILHLRSTYTCVTNLSKT